MARVTLTLEDFRRLVRGEAVEHDGVGVLLADIGFPVMIKEVLDAAHGLDPDDGAEHATVPAHWVALARDSEGNARMDPGFWLAVAPRAYDMMAEGTDEEAAVLASIAEYRVTITRRG